MEEGSTILTMESGTPDDSSQVKPRVWRCLNCQLKHIRCDGALPVCSTCLQKDRTCQYPQFSAPAAKPNVRQLASKKRAFSACLVCRAAKRKCSGETPVCGPCRKRGLEANCEYDSTTSLQRKRPEPHRASYPESPSDERPSKQPRMSLPTVLKETNGIQKQQVQPRLRRRESPSFQLLGAISETPPETDKSHEGDDEGSFIQGDESLESPRGFQPPISPLAGPSATQAPDISSVGQESGDSDGSEEVDGREPYSDSSDNETEVDDPDLFLPGVRQAVFQRTGVAKPGSTLESDRELKRLTKVTNRKTKLSTLSTNSTNLRFPHRIVANKLVSAYLSREFVNLPLFHRNTFTHRYEKLWRNIELWDSETEVSHEDCLFIGLLFGVFAIAALLCNPGHLEDAEQYFARAQNLVFLNGIEKGGILNIQAYLVLAQYLIADNNLPVAWKFVGLAIRAAQSLHLHLVTGSHHLALRDNQELSRRVWHCSLMLERIIAMKMGISTLTKHSFETPLPVPGDNDYIDHLSTNEPADRNPTIDRPSIIEFFNNSARLYDRYSDLITIQEELRLTEHCSARKKLEVFDPSPLIAVDQSLANWQSGLPPFLHPNTDVNSIKNLLAMRQHKILRIRYLHMRLLLWRPLLAIVAAASPDIDARSRMQEATSQRPLTHIIAHESAVKCVLAAAEIINIIDEAERSRGTDITNEYDALSIPAIWETTGYVFACAQVFIAARRCPRGVIDDLGGMQMIREGAWTSIELMRKYSLIWPRANACLKALEKLDILFTPGRDECRGGPRDGGLSDLSWLECLPIDLQV
ncbi:uncharacterized protein BDCG_17797 [Blastomyces dermatitidis ER-3]|uniref:Zn(2)-C6 fungal-type domain-containing protein n=3 Tax=Blastomyces TaxID=229219 RepID=A0A179UAE7_BLAGS|nr:uncharacterized protein BDBG_00213 [Blastomyces gilchristii SLH14081]XP_045282563.1 uncharacterized protein BDCG_17797 [Blastomyces dermatitidis ER-3]EGE78257.2 fungal specific transcription factor domain-containing protein [Blastomyces dermatitidis ATCC 18188]OAT02836.1 hypothetical protein BDCG_17797 [Blastomyces dermatitidis ER-3]OAT03502.1 hypothetical protein BDBG_00213 [Blastomyces gilchristii SLH14081]